MLNRTFVARREGGTNWFALTKLTLLIALSLAVFSLRLGDVPTRNHHDRAVFIFPRLRPRR